MSRRFFAAKQRIEVLVVISTMTYSFLTIGREVEGQHVVRRPRVTDVIGHSLRGAFDDGLGLPDDMARLLRELDAAPYRVN